MSLPAQHFYISLRIRNKAETNVGVEDIAIPRDNIKQLTITENVLSILPKIECVMSDVGAFVDKFTMLDDDVISIVISQAEDLEPMIEMEFNVSDYEFESDNTTRQFDTVKFVGYANSKELFVPYRNRSFNNNSSDVLQKIAKETGIKFDNPHGVIPSDGMIWYQNQNNYDFIKHILKRAFISDDTVFFYANTKNKFVYTSLNSEMGKEIDFTGKYNTERVDNFVLTEDEKDTMFFNSYEVLNVTGLFNKMSNYGATFGYYNLKGKYVGGTIYTVKKFTDLHNKSKDYDGMPSIFKNTRMNGNNNVFEEFQRGIVQNMFMKYNLFSNSVVININSMTDVKLFDKVNIGLPSPIDEFNEAYSGLYLVGSITHNITFDGVYEKKVLLCRHGINKSEELKDVNVN